MKSISTGNSRRAIAALIAVLLAVFVIATPETSSADSIIVVWSKDYKQKRVFVFKHPDEVYARLFTTETPVIRSTIMIGLASVTDGKAPLIVGLWLDDQTEIKNDPILGSGRVCDFAAKALDGYYRDPAHILTRYDNLSLKEKDQHIHNWEQWLNNNAQHCFGKGAGPTAEVLLKQPAATQPSPPTNPDGSIQMTPVKK